ncbi:MAG TPA: hypothetical protein EYQ15_04835 [Candidatus Poseidoniales archaeon]|nr:MAG: hypothetical protein CXT65_01460 [Euryarchaeota archaeon]HIG38610.1 hypothetical protein [Candidatus Poseidoniales archaeon]
MNYVIQSFSIPLHSFEQALTPLCMGDLNYRDAVWLGIVIGSMVAVMATFVAIFLSGLDSPEVMSSLRSGLVVGFAAAVVVTTFAYYRLLETSRSGKDPGAIKEQEVMRVRAILALIGERDTIWAKQSWSVEEKVRRDRGVLVVDLHGLDAPSAAALTDRLLERRSDLGRLKLVTGRGESTHPGSADPGIRPAVMQRLKVGAQSAEWQVIQKSSSVTLRPMGRAPTPKQWLGRFAVFVVPMTGAMTLAFRDLAGTGMESQGMTFGAAAGLLMTTLLSGYRDRSA